MTATSVTAAKPRRVTAAGRSARGGSASRGRSGGSSAGRIPVHRRAWFHRVVVWGGIIVLWEIAGILAGPLYFPRFSTVAVSFVEDIWNGNLLTVLVSYEQMFVGFGIAVAVGIPTGVLIGASKTADAVLGIYVNALFVLSLEAVIPLLIIIFGTDFAFRAAVVFLFAIVYIIVNTAAGVRAANPRLVETARSFTASTGKIWVSVLLPDALPYVMAGVRLGLGSAVKGMIVAELWVYFGTGELMEALGTNRDLPPFFSTAVWIVVIAAGLTSLLLYLQRRLMPWSSVSGIRLRGNA
jgi:NitT/TauT family transport system permease protein